MKLQIKVIPSSSKNCIAGWLGDTLKVKVQAPPEKGKANNAVIKVLEKALDLPKGCVEITSGATSTIKTVSISSADESLLQNSLDKLGDT
jgi:uncharacterized protein